EWETVVAEDDEGGVLEDFALAGDALVTAQSRHALSEIAVRDRDTGDVRHLVALPGPGSAEVTGRRDEQGPVWVGYTDYVTPYHVLTLDPLTASLAPDDSRSQDGQVPGRDRTAPPRSFSHRDTYRSADGTEVAITVVGPSGEPDRPRPTVLYGYGGFNIPMTPSYSSSVLAWVAAGGAWAVANLRGGSEEGEAWHRDGMRQHKQHTFEDLEAAAAWLVASGWTTPEELAIMGGSNGGLLVGAALTRQPATYAAVVCSAPLLDMVRYEQFGLGATWNDEYGTAADATELGWLLGYSPYHHVVAGVAYPAVLFTIFDGDTRVDPLHARKMAAALQWATSSAPARRPVLVRREADVGHGARAVRRQVNLAADELAFLADQLGLDITTA
ncbi:MAG: prolyl oligopeptidase family serine peptidase, partial [Acidimicrobiales bacterium]